MAPFHYPRCAAKRFPKWAKELFYCLFFNMCESKESAFLFIYWFSFNYRSLMQSRLRCPKDLRLINILLDPFKCTILGKQKA